MEDQRLNKDEKTLLLWSIVYPELDTDLFEYFTNYIYDLSPHLIVDDLETIHSNTEMGIKNRINSFILLKKSLTTVPDNEKEALYDKINGWAYDNIFQASNVDTILRENLDLYGLTSSPSNLFGVLDKLDIEAYANEYKLSVFDIWSEYIAKSNSSEEVGKLLRNINNGQFSQDQQREIDILLVHKGLPITPGLKQAVLERYNVPIEIDKDGMYSVSDLKERVETSIKVMDSPNEINDYYNQLINEYKDNPSMLTDVILTSNTSIHIKNEDLKIDLIDKYATTRNSIDDQEYKDEIDQVLNIIDPQ